MIDVQSGLEESINRRNSMNSNDECPECGREAVESIEKSDRVTHYFCVYDNCPQVMF